MSAQKCQNGQKQLLYLSLLHFGIIEQNLHLTHDSRVKLAEKFTHGDSFSKFGLKIAQKRNF